jgi:3-deoxy-D-manno-octulosonic-acid transferase
MRWLSVFLYRFVVYPVLFLTAHLAALFNETVRFGLRDRYCSVKRLKKFQNSGKEVVYFHASSLGEYEHIRPLIYRLGEKYQIVVTFFSPSGYKHAKKQFDDETHFYLPFDFYGLWRKLFRKLRPKVVIISKHDIWANQLFAAKKEGIPTFLVNASLAKGSSRLNRMYRFFYGEAYRSLTGIYTISEEDKARFEQYFALGNVKVVGDTKFDQVLIRKKQAETKHHIPDDWWRKNLVITFGSIWPEDYQIVREPLSVLLKGHAQVKLLMVPHQLHENFIEQMQKDFSQFGVARFTGTQDHLNRARVLIIDVVGILAELYQYAQIAYIGGSFKQGIHNVMEAAAYGIPVIYGPKHKNSFEAEKLAREGGAFVIKTSEEFYEVIKRLIDHPRFRTEHGEMVRTFVEKQTGATERLLKEWQRYLS